MEHQLLIWQLSKPILPIEVDLPPTYGSKDQSPTNTRSPPGFAPAAFESDDCGHTHGATSEGFPEQVPKHGTKLAAPISFESVLDDEDVVAAVYDGMHTHLLRRFTSKLTTDNFVVVDDFLKPGTARRLLEEVQAMQVCVVGINLICSCAR